MQFAFFNFADEEDAKSPEPVSATNSSQQTRKISSASSQDASSTSGPEQSAKPEESSQKCNLDQEDRCKQIADFYFTVGI